MGIWKGPDVDATEMHTRGLRTRIPSFIALVPVAHHLLSSHVAAQISLLIFSDSDNLVPNSMCLAHPSYPTPEGRIPVPRMFFFEPYCTDESWVGQVAWTRKLQVALACSPIPAFQKREFIRPVCR
jgi:hypothetical protein